MYTQLICLANSWKHGERCIAGINPVTDKWIRPISDRTAHGSVPRATRLINGEEPSLLDLLEIPLLENAPDFGFQSENLSISPGTWQKVKRCKPAEVTEYTRKNRYILHNSRKYVTVTFLQSLPFHQRHTLQLVHAVQLSVRSTERAQGGNQWKGTLITATGQQLKDAAITDPKFVKKLETGYRPQSPCLITVSLSMPHRPTNWEGDDPCWKLIAGVTPLRSN